MEKNNKKVTTAIVTAGFAAGLGILGVITAPNATLPSETDKTFLPVETMAAHEVDHYSVNRSFIGRIEARRESRVGFELGGLVKVIQVDDGETVKKGQVLAELDTELLSANRSELAAVRDQAQAELELADLTLARVREARSLNAVSNQDLDDAVKGQAVRHAALRQADATLRAVDVRIEKSKLRSPFDALVAKRHVDEGQVVPAGEPILHLLEKTHPEVRIGVGGDSIDAILPESEHKLIVRDREITATVRSILPVRERGTRSVDVVLTLDTEFDGFRRGDLATLKVKRTVTESGFWLPLAALTESSRGLWAVYTVVGPIGGTAVVQRRELEVLHQVSDRVFVRSTLKDGERVVTGGLQRLVPGLTVRLVEPTEDTLVSRVETDQ